MVNLLQHRFALLRAKREAGRHKEQENGKSVPVGHQGLDYSARQGWRRVLQNVG